MQEKITIGEFFRQNVQEGQGFEYQKALIETIKNSNLKNAIISCLTANFLLITEAEIPQDLLKYLEENKQKIQQKAVIIREIQKPLNSQDLTDNFERITSRLEYDFKRLTERLD